jgi:hypothetical protein
MACIAEVADYKAGPTQAVAFAFLTRLRGFEGFAMRKCLIFKAEI